MQQEFKLQDPGEGVREVDILEVLVAEGDTVDEGQNVLVVESDKTEDRAPEYEPKAKGEPVRASPAARRLARAHGKNLADLVPSGDDGQITETDVRAAIRAETEDGVDKEQDEFDPTERRRMSSIRAATARAMTRSWSDIPHVHHEDAADITELERWRRRQENPPTLTPIVAKAVAILLPGHPRFNATFNDEDGEIVLRRYWNINIAVATDRGLVTPVLKGVDGKSVRELAAEMATLAEKARKKKLEKADIRGGTFTITNIGGLGGRGLSPLINPPQTAILGLARASVEAVAQGGLDDATFAPRMILPMVLAVDHRVIDGADAARFMNDLIALLSDPVSLALET